VMKRAPRDAPARPKRAVFSSPPVREDVSDAGCLANHAPWLEVRYLSKVPNVRSSPA
jgi:hypothetical protein